MKNITLLFLLTFLILNFSCEPEPALEEVTDFEMTFKGKFGTEVFVVNKNDFEYNGMKTRFDQFNFYISNVALVKETTSAQEETELLEIDFVDLSFKPEDLNDAETGYTISVKNVPVGEYSGIKIGLGVPADLNRSNWGDFGEGHPLRKVAHHWSAWESFIFSKTEAHVDVDNDQSYSHKLSYHTGADEAYRTKYVAKNITLSKDEIGNISFEVDVAQMFDGVDIIQDNGTHNITDMDLVNTIMSNLQNKALTVQ